MYHNMGKCFHSGVDFKEQGIEHDYSSVNTHTHTHTEQNPKRKYIKSLCTILYKYFYMDIFFLPIFAHSMYIYAVFTCIDVCLCIYAYGNICALTGTCI